MVMESVRSKALSVLWQLNVSDLFISLLRVVIMLLLKFFMAYFSLFV